MHRLLQLNANVLLHFVSYSVIYGVVLDTEHTCTHDKCDCPSENQPSLHLRFCQLEDPLNRFGK